MAQPLELYKCDICGTIVEVLHAGPGGLVCCGVPMQLQAENMVDAAKEKHVPIITRGDGTITVIVGAVPHPMEEKHYIQWIELIADNRIYRCQLKPGETPQATFSISATNVRAREYCTLHGQWSTSA